MVGWELIIMNCPDCGKEVSKSDNFCWNCSIPLSYAAPKDKPAEDKAEPTVAQEPGTPSDSVGESGTPSITNTGFMAGAGTWVKNRKTVLLVVIPLILLIVAGAVVGVVFWTRSGPTVAAEIESVDLTFYEGGEADLEKVPLEEDLLLSIEYLAQFPENGKGTLEVMLVDNEDDTLSQKRIKCKSSEDPQTYEYAFFMPTELSNLSIDITASLEVEAGDQKINDEGALAFASEESQEEQPTEETADDEQVRAAFSQALEQYKVALNAVNELITLKIDTGGLQELLDKAYFLLENCSTIENIIGEKDSAMFYANATINECNARKQAKAAPTKPKPTEPGWATCSTCNGSGKVAWTAPEDQWIPCDRCDATGGWTDEVGNWVVCHKCLGEQGYWWSDVEPATQPCPTCSGSGKVRN